MVGSRSAWPRSNDVNAHLRITVAAHCGTVFGGHVCYGCKIGTTAAILLLETPGRNLIRVKDETTGYKELVVTHAATQRG